MRRLSRKRRLRDTEYDLPPDPERSALMARVRGKNTKPERLVRRLSHALGYRFRLHRRDLPGTPDLVFPRLRKIVLVHGCFWHRHAGCGRSTTPKTRQRFWQSKFDANVARDRKTAAALRRLGWKVLVVWECETSDAETLRKRLQKFLRSPDDSRQHVSRRSLR
ncbi:MULTISPECIES: DNA mismatch endonuclease Vsr [unclassified Bradyrhizobium]|uniref:very short patch repair endonuclease n=1 Tax=unclassified Bradyrhizobium TaxID=2631580 RepID=UPI0028E8BE52|nr:MULTISPECIES: DNA mismatch endonuclease Vsr [unclassified Bradyrhizobium]